MSRRLPIILLSIFVAAYIAYFGTYSIFKFQRFYAEYFDLGIMHQTVYNSYMGIRTGDVSRILELTTPHGGIEQIKRMAIHNDPILALLAPLYFIYASPITLILVQTVVLALGAVLVYKIAQRLLENDWTALAFSFAYLMYSPMQWANIFEFHAVTLATTGILLAVYLWMKKMYLASFLVMIVTLWTKEQVGLSLGLFGIYAFFQGWNERDKGYKLYSFSMTGVAWVWSLLSAFVIVPFFRGSSHFASGYYDNLLPNLFGRIFSGDTLHYMIGAMGPLAFLSIAAPQYLFVAAPEFAINLLSSNEQLRNPTFHYLSVIQPWLFVGSIFGLAAIAKSKPAVLRFFTFAIVASTLYFAYQNGPLPFTPGAKTEAWLYDRKGERETIAKWATQLDDDALKVSTTDQIAPHFTNRRYFYIFSPDYFHADYVVVSPGNISYSYRDGVQEAYQSLRKDSRFQKIAAENGYELYKKKVQ